MSNSRAHKMAPAKNEPEPMPVTSTIKKRSAAAMNGTIVCGEEEQSEYEETEAELEDDLYFRTESIDAPIAKLAISTPSTPTLGSTTQPKPPTNTTTTTKTTASYSKALLDTLDEGTKAILNKVTYALMNSVRRWVNNYNCDYNIKSGRVPSDLLKVTALRSQPVAENTPTYTIYNHLRIGEGELLMACAKAMQLLREEAHGQAAKLLFDEATASIARESIIAHLRNRARKIGKEFLPEEMMNETATNIIAKAQIAIDKYHVELAIERKNVAIRAKSYATRMARLAEEQEAGIDYDTPPNPRKDKPVNKMTDFYKHTEGNSNKPTKQARKNTPEKNSPKKQPGQNETHFARDTQNNDPHNQMRYPPNQMHYPNPFVPPMYPQNNGYWIPGPYGPPTGQYHTGQFPHQPYGYNGQEPNQDDNTSAPKATTSSNKRNNK